MHVKNLINSNPNWLKTLTDDLKIKVVYSPDKRLVSLKYDEVEGSPMDNPIVQECRGMVVDVIANKILCHGLDKFFNYGDAKAHSIDWQTARVQAKLDGSLMEFFWDPTLNEWTVASSGHPTAGGAIYQQNAAQTDNGMTFRDLFWQTFAAQEMKLPDKELDKETCYIFELCSPMNRIVVKHEKPTLTCLTARINTEDLDAEWSRPTLAYHCKCLNWPIVQEYPINNID